jgi:glutathione peroxidase
MMGRTLTAIACIGATLGLASCGGSDMSDPGDPPPAAATSEHPGADSKRPEAILSGTLTSLNGQPENLGQYRGKVVLVVNTATECGFTPQFDGLERLYEQKRGDGFVILGFPADDVAHQEPRDDAAIAEFCKANFGVSFPMFAKSNVVDEPVNPVFGRLGDQLGPPTWNFNKYLLDRRGRAVEHYSETTEPDDLELTSRIDELLRS